MTTRQKGAQIALNLLGAGVVAATLISVLAGLYAVAFGIGCLPISALTGPALETSGASCLVALAGWICVLRNRVSDPAPIAAIGACCVSIVIIFGLPAFAAALFGADYCARRGIPTGAWPTVAVVSASVFAPLGVLLVAFVVVRRSSRPRNDESQCRVAA